jgi:phosphohistidine phosphatase
MALYVVQHGKSLPKSEDPEKGLSAAGTAESERMAEVAGGYQVRVARILHSGKKRARQTAEIFARRLSPPAGSESCAGMNPLDDVRVFADRLRLDQDIMLVGHLPFLEKLIGLLVCDDPDRMVFKLQNSGIVCLERPADAENAVIRWAMMPVID